MTYFDLYDLPESFLPDPAALRAAYHRLSRETHPDFFANEPPEVQQQVLEKATRNTDAYRTLSDYDRRLEYLLRLHNRLGATGETPALPPAFLLEVMELNEQVMDLQFEPDPAATRRTLDAVAELADSLETAILPTLETYPTLPPDAQAAALDQILAYYLRRRYVLRLREQVAGLAVGAA